MRRVDPMAGATRSAMGMQATKGFSRASEAVVVMYVEGRDITTKGAMGMRATKRTIRACEAVTTACVMGRKRMGMAEDHVPGMGKQQAPHGIGGMLVAKESLGTMTLVHRLRGKEVLQIQMMRGRNRELNPGMMITRDPSEGGTLIILIVGEEKTDEMMTRWTTSFMGGLPVALLVDGRMIVGSGTASLHLTAGAPGVVLEVAGEEEEDTAVLPLVVGGEGGTLGLLAILGMVR